MLTEQTDEQLLAQALDGNEDAFTALYRRRQGPVYRFALHMSGSPQVAEEVTQDVFMFLLQRGRGFDPSRGAVGAYLFGVARNYVRRAMEKSHSEAMMTTPAEDDDPLLVTDFDPVERYRAKSDVEGGLEGSAVVAGALPRSCGAVRFAGVELCRCSRSAGMRDRDDSFAPASGARDAGEEVAKLGPGVGGVFG